MGIRVRAKNENVRKFIKHPITQMRFRNDINETVEWPDDAFTKRRIRDGDVEVVDEAKETDNKASARHPHRRHEEPAARSE